MKALLSTLLLVTSIAGAAIAGSNWNGFYVGAAVSSNSGNMDYTEDGWGPDAYTMVDSTMTGGFAGYNIQNGSIVYGAEVAYSAGDFAIVGYPEERIDYFLDVKARIGYASGSMLVYGFTGVSSGVYGEYQYDPTPIIDFTGSNFGVGIDYQITDHMFGGVEYILRNVGNRYREWGGRADFELQAVQVRLGYNF